MERKGNIDRKDKCVQKKKKTNYLPESCVGCTYIVVISQRDILRFHICLRLRRQAE